MSEVPSVTADNAAVACRRCGSYPPLPPERGRVSGVTVYVLECDTPGCDAHAGSSESPEDAIVQWNNLQRGDEAVDRPWTAVGEAAPPLRPHAGDQVRSSPAVEVMFGAGGRLTTAYAVETGKQLQWWAAMSGLTVEGVTHWRPTQEWELDIDIDAEGQIEPGMVTACRWERLDGRRPRVGRYTAPLLRDLIEQGSSEGLDVATFRRALAKVEAEERRRREQRQPT